MARTNPNTNVVKEPLELKELAELLVKHYGYHEGLWDLSVEFQLALGHLGPTPKEVLPAALLGVSRVGLTRANQLGPFTVDASSVNPLLETRSKETRSKKV